MGEDDFSICIVAAPSQRCVEERDVIDQVMRVELVLSMMTVSISRSA